MFTELASRLGFPEEAIEYFNEQHAVIMKDPDVYKKFFDAMDEFYFEDNRHYLEILDEISQKSGVKVYTVHMIFVLLAAKPLRYIYRQEGISDEIFYESMKDMTYKLWECKNVQGYWGTFVVWWYPDFFKMKRFKLGRLQYEKIAFPHDDYKGIVQKGDTVWNCHIPSCGPVTPESVIDSLKQAYEFYKPELKNGILPVYCSSWMLYPDHLEVYGEKSNLRAFYNMFDVIDKVENKDNHNFWRIFNVDYSPETLDDAPENTSLQRGFKKYLQSGKNMGTGKGILLFDGEKILK